MAIEKLTSEELTLFTNKVNKIETVSTIANLIKVIWVKQSKTGVNYACKPYLQALIHDDCYNDSKKSVVLYALGNMSTFKGDRAKILKNRLRQLSDKL